MDTNFLFSYSGLNKLLFSPKLFYSHYFLNEKEEKLDSYLIDGKVTHCYILEPEMIEEKFSVAPSKVPTDSVKKVLHAVHDRVGGGSLGDHHPTILEVLIEENLYQSFNEDSKRLERIVTEDHQFYFDFISNKDKTVVDEVTLARCKEQADIMMNYEEVRIHLEETNNNPRYIVKNEDYLEVQDYYVKDTKLGPIKFGLKGFIDRYVIDTENNTARIVDVKTTGKTIESFPTESIDYYKYWLQAAVYIRLIQHTYNIPVENIDYSFWVIDKYQQACAFHLSDVTKFEYLTRLDEALVKAEYHFSNMDFSLPYELLLETRYI
jgi:hypothetical protein